MLHLPRSSPADPGSEYAALLIAQRSKLRRSCDPASLVARIDEICELRMQAALQAQATNLGIPNTRLDSLGRMEISATARDANGALLYFCSFHKRFLFQSPTPRMISLAIVRAMGPERFCQSFARKLCDGLAVDEASMLHQSPAAPAPPGLLAFAEREAIAYEISATSMRPKGARL